MSGNHDNDADKRPRVYARSSTPDGEVEVTVQGAEGETSDDLENQFHDAVDKMVDSQGDLCEEGPDDRGFE